MGGSSGLNLMGWNRASKLEYDVWSTFSGSSTWSWAGLTQYFSKSQTVEQGQKNPFPGVSPAQYAASFTHGSVNGPINVSRGMSTIVSWLNIPSGLLQRNLQRYCSQLCKSVE